MVEKDSPKDRLIISALGEFYPFFGGIAQYIESISYALHTSHSIEILASGRKSLFQKEWKYGRVRRFRITRYTLLQKFIGMVIQLVSALKSPHSILFTHPLDISCYLSIARFFRLVSPRTKVLVCMYGTEIADMKEGTGLLKFDAFMNNQNHIDSIIVISSYVKQLLIETCPDLDAKKISLIHPTIPWHLADDQEARSLNTQEVLGKFGLRKGDYLVSIGRLVKRKGHHILLKQLPDIVSKHPGIKYVVIGDGVEKSPLLKLADQLNMMQNFVITGDINDDEKFTLLKNSSVYVHPSTVENEKHQRVEGFGIAVLEAMFASKPVVVFNSGGLVDLVQDFQQGRIITKHSELKKAIIELLHDSRKSVQYGEKGRETYEQSFSTNIFREKFFQAFSQKKSILYIVEWFYPVLGGAGIQAEKLARRLAEKYSMQIACKYVPSTSSRIEHKDGLQIVRFGNGTNGRTNDYLSALSLFKYIFTYRNKIDLIHLHGNIENNFPFFASMCGKILGIPVIAKLSILGELEKHVESDYHSPVSLLFKCLNPFNAIRRFTSKRLDHYIAISNSLVDELRKVGIRSNKIVKIPNGVDLTKFYPPTEKEREGSRRALDIPREKNVFVCVSRLAQHKGIISPLLKVWKNDFKDDENALLLIVGGGENLSTSIEEEVRQFVDENAIMNVRIEGRQENVISYLQASEYYLHPSENEGLSNSLLEAAACGLVCVVSKVSGNTDVINELRGFLFEPGNQGSFREALKRATKTPHARKTKMSITLTNFIKSEYDIEKTVKKIEALYKSCIHEHSPLQSQHE